MHKVSFFHWCENRTVSEKYYFTHLLHKLLFFNKFSRNVNLTFLPLLPTERIVHFQS
jgi:hypothetical protein